MSETPAASHDSGTPENLLTFMMSGWATPPSTPASPVAGVERFAARREALSRAFRGETLIVPTGHEKVRSNDTAYRFRPGSDFYYLTGNVEPDNVLVLLPQGDGHAATLYCEPNPGKTDKTFFTDRMKGELWVGPRLGLPQTQQRYGIPTKALSALPDDLKAALGGGARYRMLRAVEAELDAAVPAQAERDAAFATHLSEMRLIKDELEVRELRRAVDATHHAFDDVVRALPSAETERTIEGVFNLRARVEGNDTGYATIAATGPNATTLHWTRNDRRIGENELLLLDAGVEAETLYTADVTRTVPISGRFTPEQRAIYDLVFAAQEAALAECNPGNDFLEPNRAAMKVLAQGLERLGIIQSAEEALREENQFHKRYSLHNVSHMLGLDVHDCATARAETYKFGKLQPGMVLTVEPGLYFQLDDLTVPARYRGIGVRIEDDVLITQTGVDVLSAAIPREADDVEAWISSAIAESRPEAVRRPSR